MKDVFYVPHKTILHWPGKPQLYNAGHSFKNTLVALKTIDLICILGLQSNNCFLSLCHFVSVILLRQPYLVYL